MRTEQEVMQRYEELLAKKLELRAKQERTYAHSPEGQNLQDHYITVLDELHVLRWVLKLNV